MSQREYGDARVHSRQATKPPAIAALRARRQVSRVMETTRNSEGVFSPGCEPVVEDDERRRLLWLMVEYFRTLGYTDIKARLPGLVPPPVLSGTLEDHRPDFTCRQTDTARTPIILEVVTSAGVADPRAENRWSLLASAARLYSAELHFVVPRWHAVGPLDPLLRRRLGRMELVANRVWNV